MNHYHYLLQHEFIEICKNFSEKTALIINYHEFSYKKLYQDCLYQANFFKENGVLRGDRVIIQAGNSYLAIVSFWAALFCDAVPCIIDEVFDESVLENIVMTVEPRFAIVSDFKTSSYKIYRKHNVFCYERINNSSFENKIKKKLFFKNTESDLAIIMHTSGSTGAPKGVMLSHRNVVAATHSIRSYLALTSQDVILSVLPMHFDYGLYQMLLSFLLGATLVLEKNALFPNKLALMVPRYHVSVLPCVPGVVQIFYLLHQKYSCDFSSVRLVTNTGENLSLSNIDRIKKIFPQAIIYSMYGLTECKRCSYVPPEMLDKKYASIGIPMPNLEMWIQDNHGNRLSPNTEGELVIAGPTVMMGYWKNNEASEKKIKTEPSGKRVLMTGDKAMMDDDEYFYFKGREDSVEKFKGIKICLSDYIRKIGEIDCVSRSHLTIKNNKLVVFVEPTFGKHDVDQLRLSILKQFAGNQKPDEIYFLDKFPSLSNGKIDIKTLEDKEFSLCI